MGRKKKKPGYNPIQVQREMMEIVQHLYMEENPKSKNREGTNRSLRSVANEMDISVSKVVKLLITAGAYHSELSEQVSELYEAGEDIRDIQEELGVSRATVHSYLPYRKGVYNAKETSLNADRIRKYRERQATVYALQENRNINTLWSCIELFEGYGFKTARGLRFKYSVKGGEIFVDRKETSKSITKSTVELAYRNGIDLMQTVGVVSGPKKLGTFGASYLFPIFIRFGIISDKRMLS